MSVTKPKFWDLSYYFWIAICIVPVWSVYIPRFLAFYPPILGIVMAAWWVFREKQTLTIPRPYLIWTWALGILLCLSTLWSVNPADSFQQSFVTFLILLCGGCFFALGRTVPMKSIKHLFWAFPVCVGIGAILNGLELSFDMAFYRVIHGYVHIERMSSAAMNRGVVCEVLAFFPALAFIAASELSQAKKHVLSAFLVLSVFFMLFMTQSQSAQLAFATGTAMYFLFPYKHKKPYIILGVLLAVILLIAPWIAHSVFYYFGPLMRNVDWLKDGYAANRLEIWDFISRYALQKPFYGYGLQATEHIRDFDVKFIFHKEQSVLHPHNFALQLWIELGLLGAAFGAALLAYISLQIGKLSAPSARVALPVFIAALTVASTGYGLWQGWWIGEFVYLLALCAMAMRAVKEQAKETKTRRNSSLERPRKKTG